MANSTTFNIILKGIADFKDVASNIDMIQKNLNQLKLPADLKSKFTGIFSDLEKESAKYQKYLDSGFKTKGDVTGLEKTGNRIKSLFESLASTMQKISPDILKDSFVFDTKQFDDLTQGIQRVKQEMESLANEGKMSQAFDGMQNALKELSKMSKSNAISGFADAFKKGNIEGAEQALQKLRNNVDKFQDKAKGLEFKELLKPLEEALIALQGNTALQDKQKELHNLMSQLSGLEASQIENFFKAFESGKVSIGELGPQWDKFRRGAEDSARSVFDLGNQMDQLKHKIGYFFGITNIFNIFKRTVKEAINTVKELDAVMTETAVVTDFTVSDMWEKLPEYAAQANALGASIRDLYAATTLYYQQGLNSQQAMTVGVETMKMARIAGMEAADATTAMTAALRGFNMEVNEMNAQRVNDVYSELAAITAADTNQIATAMGKTASIANSANMEFETTAALLAQIIETTQEAPETAGTAMKTIIARFTEVKKLFSEGQLTGEDEEGEAISINKIDDALKSVGISLKDFLNGSKGIDEIFLELASKWDTLDLATQRYIATAAAGSRQQSRFIAMMSNYDRTMELVTAANNSAGASQEQFDKTLDSMEAKLQALSNAWNEFVMGLANNDVLKAGVDALTGLLNTINNITSSLSGGSGAGKSIANFMTVIGALAGGRALAKGAFGWIGAQMGLPDQASGKNGALAGASFFGDDAARIAAIEGQKAGTSFAQSASRAMVSAKNGGNFRSSVRSFFTMNQMVDYSKVYKSREAFMNKVYDLNPNQFSKDWRAFLPVADAFDAGGIDAANAKLKELGLQSVKTSEMVKTIPINFQAIGAAAMGIGGALGLLANHFEKIGNTKAAETTKKLSTIFMGLGSTIMIVSSVLPGLGNAFSIAGGKIVVAGVASQAAWWWLLAIPAAIAGIALAASAISKAAYAASPEGRLEKVTTEAEGAGAAAENAAKGYDELKSSLESIKSQETTIENMTRGTDEWKKAVQNLNSEILALIDGNAALSDFVEYKNGSLGFDYSKTNASGQTVQDVLNEEYLQSQIAQQAALKSQKDVLAVKQQNYFRSEELAYGTPQYNGVVSGSMTAKNVFQKVWWKEIGKDTNKVFEDLTNEVADKIASGEIRDMAQAQNYVNSLNVDGYERLHIVANGKNEEETFLQLKQLGELRRDSQAKGKIYEDTIAGNLLEGASLSQSTKEFLGNLDSDLINTGYHKIYDQKFNEIKDMTITTAAKQEYAGIADYIYDEVSDKFYTMENGKKVEVEGDITDDQIRAAIATERASKDYYSSLNDMGKEIESKTKEQKDLISQVFGKDQSGMSGEALNKYGQFDVESGAFKLREGAVETMITDMGFTLETFEETFGMTIEQATEQIAASLESGGDAFIDARKKVVGKMTKYTGKDQKDFFGLATKLQVYEEAFGEEIVGVISNVFSSLELSGDNELVSSGYQAFQEVLETGTMADVEDASEFISSINWNNSIEALAAINQELDTGVGASKQFAQSLKDSNAAYFDIGNLTKDLIGSEQFSSISEELDKILLANEELSATDVKELAKSYSVLDKYLENTEITASGLAKALTLVQNGELTMNQLTDSVMKALSSFNSLEDMVADTIESLNNLDYGVDENTVAEKTKEMAETLRANIDKGAYGNNQNFTILDYMFGPGWDKGLSGDALEAEMERLTKILEDNSENYLNAWKDLAEQGQKSDWLSISYKDGEAFLEGFEGHTTEEIVQEMARAYGMTENMARMMLTDFKNYSSDLAVELAANDFTAGIAAMEDSLQIGYDGYQATKFIDESEIQALVEATGKSRDEIWHALSEEAGRGGFMLTATEFYDKEGILKTGEELFTELDKLAGGTSGAWKNKYQTSEWTKYDEGENWEAYKTLQAIDFASMKKDLTTHGFTENEQMAIGNEMLQELWTNGESHATLKLKGDNGELIDVVLEAGETMQDAYDRLDYTETSNQMTNAIVAAFEQIETFDINLAEGTETTVNSVLAKLQDITMTANTDGLTTAVNGWLTENGEQTITFNASVNPATITMSADGGSGTFTVSVGPAAAKGLVNAPRNMMALTGEEGPELIQTDGGYYIVGQNGPEMANIKKGDTVYTAEQTKRILRGTNHSLAPRYASGYGKANTGGSGGKGSGDDGWETSIDKLYNLLRDIDEELRQRENLERRYNSLLEKIGTNTGDLVKVTRQTLAQLEKERGLQEELIAGRNSQIDAYLKEQSKYNKYAWVEKDEWGDRVLRIDWAAIDAISNEEEGKKVEEYLKQLETWMEDVDGAKDTIADIDDTVREIYERGKDEYFDLESSIRDALEGERQKEIDKLSEINDTINDTNTRLLDSIQDSIDEQRQARDNAKTEEELADKQRRLSYLQMDTSGANALEILELQRELEEGQRDYTDNLIDQKISALQKQNDEAAQQRQDQIDIMQAQLDHYIKSGEVWQDAYELMQSGINSQGIIVGSSLWDVLAGNEDYASKSNLEKLKWAEEINDNVALAMLYLKSGQSTEGLINSGELKKGGKVTFTTSDGTTVTGTLKDNGDIVDDKTGQTYKDVYKNWDGSFKTDESYISEKYVAPEPVPAPAPAPTPAQDPKPAPTWKYIEKYRGPFTDDVYRPMDGGWFIKKWWEDNLGKETNVTYTKKTASTNSLIVGGGGGGGAVAQRVLLKYASGGLATETGPAWLDGSKSRPEYVLNAGQTQAFLTLVDVLEGFGRGNVSNSQNSGDNTYDIDINVESIGSDYDVEQLANTVKRLINDDARYRNNNTIGYSR